MNNWLSSERNVICGTVSVGFPRGSFNNGEVKIFESGLFFLLVPRLCEDSLKGILWKSLFSNAEYQ